MTKDERELANDPCTVMVIEKLIKENIIDIGKVDEQIKLIESFLSVKEKEFSKKEHSVLINKVMYLLDLKVELSNYHGKLEFNACNLIKNLGKHTITRTTIEELDKFNADIKSIREEIFNAKALEIKVLTVK